MIKETKRRKITNEEVLDNEERLNFTLESMDVGTWDMDLHDHTAYQSLQHDRIFGYEKKLPSWTFDDFLRHILPEYREPVKKMVEEATAAGSGWTYECPIRRADGQIRWIWFTGRYYTDHSGHNRAVGVVQDITERKRVEERVRYNQKMMAEAEALSNTGAWEWDVLTDIWRFSDQWAKIHGVKNAEKLKSEELLSMAYPQDRSNIIRAMDELRRGIKQYDIEHRIIRKDDGEERFVHARGRFIKDPNGNVVKVYGFAQDITARKKAQDALRKSNEALKQSNRELEDFANAAAHDLKEPLRSIASFSYLLEKDLRNVLDERSSEYFKYIKDATNRMQRLIMDLLTYAKIGVEDKPFGPVDLNEIMENVKSGLKTILEAERALINFRGLPTIIADKSMMRQLFQNLISNAVKFHKPDVAPVINVFAEEKPDEWQIAVNDNGIGIEEKFYEKVFVVFSRLHMRDKYEGTGIGLSLCKKIVDKHEGRIWIDSKLGEGTTIYITIPKKPRAVV